MIDEMPDNWHCESGTVAAGPAVILDLDGVISDASHRQHFLREGRRDWKGFFTAAVDDPPIASGLVLAASIATDHTVAILTARPHYITDITRSWLAANEVRHDLLIIRPKQGPGSQGPSSAFKSHELERLRARGITIAFAVDDDQRIIDMYRSEGVFALYVHSGYYER